MTRIWTPRSSVFPGVTGAPGDHRYLRRHMLLCFSLALLLATCTPPADHPAPGVTDPGVRGGDPRAGGPLPGLTADETTLLKTGKSDFLKSMR